jgi:DNA-directed RNA polymerase subunit H (RpoH/RPB5)
MESNTNIVNIVIRIISLMGLRGYNILPFNFLLENEMKNEYYMKRGMMDKINFFNEAQIKDFIGNYRFSNFNVECKKYKFRETNPESLHFFSEGRSSFSLIFDHSRTGLRTAVLIDNSVDENTSTDSIRLMINNLKYITNAKTNGISADPFLKENNMSVIFVVSLGISSSASTFISGISNIEIMTDDQILNKCYDNCLQPHFKSISTENKLQLLTENGLKSNLIPSLPITDILSKSYGYKENDLIVINRGPGSEEESTGSVSIRIVK